MDIASAVISAIQLAIAAAPKVEALYISARDFITSMFVAKIITVEQQNALHAHVDSLQKMALAGIVPPAWTVEPDPEPTTTGLAGSGTPPPPPAV